METTGADGPADLDDEAQARLRRAVPDAMLGTPYLSGLGLVVERYEPDEVTVRLPFRAELTNDGAVYHGGVVATVLDTTAAAAAWSNHDFARGTRAATVSLSVQYLGSARRSDLVCHARVIRRAKELVFTEVTAADATGRVTAHALQTYRIA